MNALRIIIAALTFVVTGIINPNPVQACEPADCPNFPVSPPVNQFQSVQRDAVLALTQVGAVNASVGTLSKQLRSARWQLNTLRKQHDADSANNRAAISSLEARIVDLEARLRTSCASIEDAVAAAPCWEALDKAAGGTNQSTLAVINNALQEGVPFSGKVIVGRTDVTPGSYINFSSPSDNAGTLPAFARTRALPPVEDTSDRWVYFGLPAVTTLAGGLIGYGYGDDSEVRGGNFEEGNKVETVAIGAGIGLGVGLLTDLIYYGVTKP